MDIRGIVLAVKSINLFTNLFHTNQLLLFNFILKKDSNKMFHASCFSAHSNESLHARLSS